MSYQQQNKICKGCHYTRESWEFFKEKGIILKNVANTKIILHGHIQ